MNRRQGEPQNPSERCGGEKNNLALPEIDHNLPDLSIPFLNFHKIYYSYMLRPQDEVAVRNR
jgi:hypothetical protein